MLKKNLLIFILFFAAANTLQAAEVNIMSLNMGMGGTKKNNKGWDGANQALNKIVNVVRKHEIDILALQEVFVKADAVGGIDEPAALSAKLAWGGRGKSSRFVGARKVDETMWDEIPFDVGQYSDAEYGNALLQNLTTADYNKIQKWTVGPKGKERRKGIAIKYKFRDDVRLWLVNTHLDHKGGTPSVALQQVDEILNKRVNTFDKNVAVLVVGDLNIPNPGPEYQCPPGKPDCPSLKSNFTKAGFKVYGENGVTHPSSNTRLDYMFFRNSPDKDFKVKNVSIIETPGISDHHAIKLTLVY